MSYEIVTGKCPRCGSPLEYDSETEHLRCVHCPWNEEPNS